MIPIPVITIILMLAIKIRSYRYNMVVLPNIFCPFVQPPKNLDSVWLNLILLILIFANMAGSYYYYDK